MPRPPRGHAPRRPRWRRRAAVSLARSASRPQFPRCGRRAGGRPSRPEDRAPRRMADRNPREFSEDSGAKRPRRTAPSPASGPRRRRAATRRSFAPGERHSGRSGSSSPTGEFHGRVRGPRRNGAGRFDPRSAGLPRLVRTFRRWRGRRLRRLPDESTAAPGRCVRRDGAGAAQSPFHRAVHRAGAETVRTGGPCVAFPSTRGVLEPSPYLRIVPPGVSIVIASHNTRAHLQRSLSAIGDGYEVVVVDTGSTDGSPVLVREQFPHVRLVELHANPGYGTALNRGIAVSSRACVLLMNGDAWPRPHAIERLVDSAERELEAGVIGPRLLNPDGTLQPSVRGFPTLWRLLTEYLFLRWLAPSSRALNAFYGSRFDHRSRHEAEFLVGAVLLARRQLLEEIGGFDEQFFMFNEEVDFCFRARAAGWTVVFRPEAEFVHVGGASTSQLGPRMYREQLRSHLRFLAKHHGVSQAERARKLLAVAMRVRAVVFLLVRRPDRRRLSVDAAAWLRSADARSLLESG